MSGDSVKQAVGVCDIELACGNTTLVDNSGNAVAGTVAGQQCGIESVGNVLDETCFKYGVDSDNALSHKFVRVFQNRLDALELGPALGPARQSRRRRHRESSRLHLPKPTVCSPS